MSWFAILSFLSVAAAQVLPAPGSIEGAVRGEGNGPPLADIMVWTRGTQTKTDSQGHYAIRGVLPGRQQVNVETGGRSAAASGSKTVTVLSGQFVTLNFSLPLKGTISGKVVDENDEPVPGVEVTLIDPEYEAGAIRYYRRNLVVTNDEGQYRMEFVQPGTPHLVLFRAIDLRSRAAISDAPAEPKLRRKTMLPAYYPGTPDRDGAAIIELRGGEHREQINVRLMSAASYCIEALLTAEGRPARMQFQIHEAHLSYGIGPSGGLASLPPGGESGPDGRVRICDLHPGEYRLTAFTGDVNQPQSFATIPVTIRDRDAQNVGLQPVPRLPPLQVELMWADKPPEKAVETKLGVLLISMTRAFAATAGSGLAAPPASLQVSQRNAPGLLMDDYSVRVRGLTDRLYVREILYGAENIMHAPVRFGATAPGTAIRILVGHEGGILNVRVNDHDGNPVPFASVVVMPTSAASEGELAASLVNGQADQNGDYVSSALMPGKYFILAAPSEIGTLNPESVQRLWLARNHATEISLDSNATLAVKVEMTKPQ